MSNPLNKTPFLYLLLPLIVGIALQYYGKQIIWSMIFSLIGGSIMLLSFTIRKENAFSYRWLSGVGIILLFISIGGGRTYIKQNSLDYSVNDSTQIYIAYVTQTPQAKLRTIAYKVHIEKEDMDIVCYLSRDSTRQMPEVGDEIIFLAPLQEIKNAGNPDEFDYKAYMYNQGFVASAYLSPASWLLTDKKHSSFAIEGLKFRQKILDFFNTLNLNSDEVAMLSALTLGYQDTLSDDLLQAFRTTGTVHILSVSGLHVGIIYAMISFLLSFIPRRSRLSRLRPLFIILFLCCYSFITGLPPSVIRASIMLSVFCIGQLFDRKNNGLNTLFIAAFGMLLFNPFWLFDIGFQLSFVSVLSILLLHKRVVEKIEVKNRIALIIWQLFALSLVAQLGVFPLCIYYFGTFPTYFFLANLIIVPFVSFIMYAVGLLLFLFFIESLFGFSSEGIYYVATKASQFLVDGMIQCARFFEKLPYALIEGIELSFPSLVLLVCIIVGISISFIYSRSKVLIITLMLFIVFIFLELAKEWKTKDTHFIVYSRSQYSDTRIFSKGKSHQLEDLIVGLENPVIELGNKKLLIINKTPDTELLSASLYFLDYALLMDNADIDLESFARFYQVPLLIVDGSCNALKRKQLTKECENRDIKLHDVTKKGAFTIIF